MNTAFLLMARYNAIPVIPIETVQQDYFSHLTVDLFKRKCTTGEIRLPLTRSDKSQKTSVGVSLADLAAYLDAQQDAGRKEAEQLWKKK